MREEKVEEEGWWKENQFVFVVPGESPGGILSGTHGKCGLLDCWTAGQPPRVVTGATCRAGRAVERVE